MNNSNVSEKDILPEIKKEYIYDGRKVSYEEYKQHILKKGYNSPQNHLLYNDKLNISINKSHKLRSIPKFNSNGKLISKPYTSINKETFTKVINQINTPSLLMPISLKNSLDMYKKDNNNEKLNSNQSNNYKVQTQFLSPKKDLNSRYMITEVNKQNATKNKNTIKTDSSNVDFKNIDKLDKLALIEKELEKQASIFSKKTQEDLNYNTINYLKTLKELFLNINDEVKSIKKNNSLSIFHLDSFNLNMNENLLNVDLNNQILVSTKINDNKPLKPTDINKIANNDANTDTKAGVSVNDNNNNKIIPTNKKVMLPNDADLSKNALMTIEESEKKKIKLDFAKELINSQKFVRKEDINSIINQYFKEKEKTETDQAIIENNKNGKIADKQIPFNFSIHIKKDKVKGYFKPIGYITICSSIATTNAKIKRDKFVLQDDDDEKRKSDLNGSAEDAYNFNNYIRNLGDQYVEHGRLTFSNKQIDCKPKKEFLSILRNFFNTNNEASLLYYSGHCSKEGKLLFETHEGPYDIDYYEFISCWKNRTFPKKNKHLMIILDCCHSGIWVNLVLSNGDYLDVSIQASSRYNQFSYDLGGNGSLYTNVLIYSNTNSEVKLKGLMDKYKTKLESQTPVSIGLKDIVYYDYGFEFMLYNNWKQYSRLIPTSSYYQPLSSLLEKNSDYLKDIESICQSHLDYDRNTSMENKKLKINLMNRDLPNKTIVLIISNSPDIRLEITPIKSLNIKLEFDNFLFFINDGIFTGQIEYNNENFKYVLFFKLKSPSFFNKTGRAAIWKSNEPKEPYIGRYINTYVIDSWCIFKIEESVIQEIIQRIKIIINNTTNAYKKAILNNNDYDEDKNKSPYKSNSPGKKRKSLYMPMNNDSLKIDRSSINPSASACQYSDLKTPEKINLEKSIIDHIGDDLFEHNEDDIAKEEQIKDKKEVISEEEAQKANLKLNENIRERVKENYSQQERVNNLTALLDLLTRTEENNLIYHNSQDEGIDSDLEISDDDLDLNEQDQSDEEKNENEVIVNFTQFKGKKIIDINNNFSGSNAEASQDILKKLNSKKKGLSGINLMSKYMQSQKVMNFIKKNLINLKELSLELNTEKIEDSNNNSVCSDVVEYGYDDKGVIFKKQKTEEIYEKFYNFIMSKLYLNQEYLNLKIKFNSKRELESFEKVLEEVKVSELNLELDISEELMTQYNDDSAFKPIPLISTLKKFSFAFNNRKLESAWFNDLIKVFQNPKLISFSLKNIDLDAVQIFKTIQNSNTLQYLQYFSLVNCNLHCLFNDFLNIDTQIEQTSNQNNNINNNNASAKDNANANILDSVKLKTSFNNISPNKGKNYTSNIRNINKNNSKSYKDKIIFNRNLIFIDLSKNKINNEGLDFIFHALHNSKIRFNYELSLSDNLINNFSLKKFKQFFFGVGQLRELENNKNNVLKDQNKLQYSNNTNCILINLQENLLNEKFHFKYNKAITFNSLLSISEINISNTYLSDVNKLVKIISNKPTLKTLKIRNCKLYNENLVKLLDVIGLNNQNSISYLDISNNTIYKMEKLNVFVYPFKCNKKLETLIMDYCLNLNELILSNTEDSNLLLLDNLFENSTLKKLSIKGWNVNVNVQACRNIKGKRIYRSVDSEYKGPFKLTSFKITNKALYSTEVDDLNISNSNIKIIDYELVENFRNKLRNISTSNDYVKEDKSKFPVYDNFGIDKLIINDDQIHKGFCSVKNIEIVVKNKLSKEVLNILKSYHKLEYFTINSKSNYNYNPQEILDYLGNNLNVNFSFSKKNVSKKDKSSEMNKSTENIRKSKDKKSTNNINIINSIKDPIEEIKEEEENDLNDEKEKDYNKKEAHRIEDNDNTVRKEEYNKGDIKDTDSKIYYSNYSNRNNDNIELSSNSLKKILSSKSNKSNKSNQDIENIEESKIINSKVDSNIKNREIKENEIIKYLNKFEKINVENLIIKNISIYTMTELYPYLVNNQYLKQVINQNCEEVKKLFASKDTENLIKVNFKFLKEKYFRFYLYNNSITHYNNDEDDINKESQNDDEERDKNDLKFNRAKKLTSAEYDDIIGSLSEYEKNKLIKIDSKYNKDEYLDIYEHDIEINERSDTISSNYKDNQNDNNIYNIADNIYAVAIKNSEFKYLRISQQILFYIVSNQIILNKDFKEYSVFDKNTIFNTIPTKTKFLKIHGNKLKKLYFSSKRVNSIEAIELECVDLLPILTELEQILQKDAENIIFYKEVNEDIEKLNQLIYQTNNLQNEDERKNLYYEDKLKKSNEEISKIKDNIKKLGKQNSEMFSPSKISKENKDLAKMEMVIEKNKLINQENQLLDEIRRKEFQEKLKSLNDKYEEVNLLLKNEEMRNNKINEIDKVRSDKLKKIETEKKALENMRKKFENDQSNYYSIHKEENTLISIRFLTMEVEELTEQIDNLNIDKLNEYIQVEYQKEKKIISEELSLLEKEFEISSLYSQLIQIIQKQDISVLDRKEKEIKLLKSQQERKKQYEQNIFLSNHETNLLNEFNITELSTKIQNQVSEKISKTKINNKISYVPMLDLKSITICSITIKDDAICLLNKLIDTYIGDTLIDLQLVNTFLKGYKFKQIAKSLNKITSLNLSFNYISDKTFIDSLTSLIQLGNLQHLNLSYCGLNQYFMKNLLDSLATKEIKSYDNESPLKRFNRRSTKEIIKTSNKDRLEASSPLKYISPKPNKEDNDTKDIREIKLKSLNISGFELFLFNNNQMEVDKSISELKDKLNNSEIKDNKIIDPMVAYKNDNKKDYKSLVREYFDNYMPDSFIANSYNDSLLQNGSLLSLINNFYYETRSKKAIMKGKEICLDGIQYTNAFTIDNENTIKDYLSSFENIKLHRNSNSNVSNDTEDQFNLLEKNKSLFITNNTNLTNLEIPKEINTLVLVQVDLDKIKNKLHKVLRNAKNTELKKFVFIKCYKESSLLQTIYQMLCYFRNITKLVIRGCVLSCINLINLEKILSMFKHSLEILDLNDNQIIDSSFQNLFNIFSNIMSTKIRYISFCNNMLTRNSLISIINSNFYLSNINKNNIYMNFINSFSAEQEVPYLTKLFEYNKVPSFSLPQLEICLKENRKFVFTCIICNNFIGKELNNNLPICIYCVKSNLKNMYLIYLYHSYKCFITLYINKKGMSKNEALFKKDIKSSYDEKVKVKYDSYYLNTEDNIDIDLDHDSEDNLESIYQHNQSANKSPNLFFNLNQFYKSK